MLLYAAVRHFHFFHYCDFAIHDFIAAIDAMPCRH